MSPVLNKIWQVAATIPEKRFRFLAAIKKKEKKIDEKKGIKSCSG